MESEQQCLDLAKQWAANPYFDDASRNEIQNLLQKNDSEEIIDRFYKDLEFGTGGMRAVIGFGRNRMSRYSVRKATQALCMAIKKSFSQSDLKVAVSYDSRRFSKEFAQEVCCVLAGNGIQALIYDRLNPVALLSWSIRYHKAQAGVMITASHNPPEYNGYKAFWADGAQVTPPADQDIIEAYDKLSDFNQIQYQAFDDGIASGLIKWVGKEVEDAYYEMLKSTAINPQMCREKGKELSLVFTPIHGTGKVPCTRILDELGMTNYKLVEQQAEPDENFSTVKSPNPEDPEAMQMALDLMKKEKADLAFGTDPDTDRLGVIVSHQGDYEFLTGNQIGLLMLNYIFSQKQEKGNMPANPYFVKTIVTSKLQDTVAKSFGVESVDTLTGFKWICRKVKEYEEKYPEKNFIFATEESFGYLSHENVRDKDGVNAVALMAEVGLFYKLQGKTLVDGLNEIYEQFGFSNETLLSINYYGKEGAEKIQRIMDNFRHFEAKEFAGESVEFIEDYIFSERNYTNGEKEVLNMTKSNVLGFGLGSGNQVYLRPSGTEPKIKFYVMVKVSEGNLADKKKLAKDMTEMYLSYIKQECEKA